MVFLGRDGNRGCQLVGLAVEDVGTENCRVMVAAVEGRSKESKESGLEAIVVWTELSDCSGTGIGAGGMEIWLGYW